MLRLCASTTALLLYCATVSAQAQEQSHLALHFASFDPLEGEPIVPARFAAAPSQRLSIVQFASIPTPDDRTALQQLGVDIHWYAPHNGFVVRANAAQRERMAKLPSVRWVGAFHPAYKIETPLFADLVANTAQPGRFVLVMTDPKRDEQALVAAVTRAGGAMWRHAAGNLLIEADLTPAQLTTLAHEDTVLWIQRVTEVGTDMNNARIQGGANTIEQLAGHTGKGVRGHIMEGIYPNHPEYAANAYRTIPMSVFSGAATTHGNSTFGINFSSGVVANARGMCPDGQGYFTDYNYIINSPVMTTAQNTRYGVVQAITDPSLQWKVMYQTASWGYGTITAYDARSAEMDWIIHQFDIPICQSQSNTSNQNSRPQAWAKNIISVGAIDHNDTANPNDDTQSGTSMGPAADGRIKPDLCAYYETIHSTNGATTYTTGFGGTSGATPIVAGHLGLTLEMFTDGYFGHAATPGWQNRFDYKPHFSTAKALMINTARQYDPAVIPAGAASRYRQGWGFPALHDMYDLRNQMLVLDEIDVLQQGGNRTYFVQVKPGTPQFRTTMVYADLPAASPFTAPHRVNNLDLKVTAPNGTVYHGNTGMATGTTAMRFTSSGGSPNNVDTVENVFVQNPATGIWRVEVNAPLIALDQHVETPAVDSDFAIVSSGIGGGRDTTGAQLDLVSTGPGNLSVALTNAPASFVDGFVMFSFTSQRPLGMGEFLGLEVDSLSFIGFGGPATPGDPLHFAPTANPALFPNTPFVFPTWIPALLQGATLNAVAFFFDATGTVHAASNVDRVVIQ